MVLIKSVFKDEPPGTNIEDTFMAIYDVVFVNDNPALSFPFLSPPNTFYLGSFNLGGCPLDPLPEDCIEFLAKCPVQTHSIFFWVLSL